jgi:hypothetical protein
LKFEYLNEVENAGNFKSNAFSGDSGWESALPSTICNSYGRGWRKSPLGREGGRGEEEGGGGGEKERMKRFNRPPPRYIWDGFTIRSIRTYVQSIRMSGVSGQMSGISGSPLIREEFQ